ncbi:MAG: ATP-binding protein [Rhodospirillales bacterium]
MTEATNATRRRALSVRRYLLALVLSLALPCAAFVAVLISVYVDSERARLTEEARTAVLDLARAIDRDVTSITAMLGIMIAAPTLRAGELDRYADLLRVASDRLGGPVDLVSVDGDAAGDGPRVSGVLSSADRPRAFEIAVPPDRPGTVLRAEIPVERIRATITAAGLPQPWTVAVVDREGRVVARSSRHDEFVGRLATADLRHATAGMSGTWWGTTLTGQSVFGAYARAPSSDWRVAVGVARTTLEAPLYRGLGLLALVGFVLVALSAILARRVQRLIVGPLAALTGRARALGRDEPVPPLASGIAEADAAGEALSQAAADLAARARERDASEAALRSLAETLEAQVRERTRELSEANAILVAEATRRARMEDQSRQMQKMEAVGQLTGGIAHDFNNMLAVVIGSLDMLRRRMTDGDERQRSFVENALNGAERAANLTRRLLAFSRQQSLSPEVLDVNRLVTGMSEILHRTIASDVRIETVLASGLWNVHADPNQIENAILNLALNARDAMPAGGRLTIETGNVWLDDADAATQVDVAPGPYVMIAVSDTGTGMTPDVAARALDPFFTTKAVGKGTGMGLSQVFGFVKQSGGHVKIDTEAGQGTSVTIYLPRPPAALVPDPPIPLSVPAEPVDGRETVLVVEDEEAVRRFTVEALVDLGYRVLEAPGATDALRLLETRADVALLFTDVVMPGMNGRQLADAARGVRPDLRVLYTSGYTRKAVVHNGVLDPGVQMIAKPYTVEELARKIREALSGPG